MARESNLRSASDSATSIAATEDLPVAIRSGFDKTRIGLQLIYLGGLMSGLSTLAIVVFGFAAPELLFADPYALLGFFSIPGKMLIGAFCGSILMTFLGLCVCQDVKPESGAVSAIRGALAFGVLGGIVWFLCVFACFNLPAGPPATLFAMNFGIVTLFSVSLLCFINFIARVSDYIRHFEITKGARVSRYLLGVLYGSNLILALLILLVMASVNSTVLDQEQFAAFGFLVAVGAILSLIVAFSLFCQVLASIHRLIRALSEPEIHFV